MDFLEVHVSINSKQAGETRPVLLIRHCERERSDPVNSNKLGSIFKLRLKKQTLARLLRSRSQ